MKIGFEPAPDEPSDEVLAAVLEIPSLAEETSGATRVVRCLVKPSFHPECSISVVERGSATELAVRVPARSVYSFIKARTGSPFGNPAVDWVKPAVSVERFALTENAAASWRSALEEIVGTPFPESAAWGLDGTGVDTVLWRSSSEHSFKVWFGPYNETDNRHRLVRVVLDTALRFAQWTQSLTALTNRSYLRG